MGGKLMATLTAENVVEFMQDMRALELAGEADTVKKMATHLHENFKGYGNEFATELLDAAATAVADTNPANRIGAIDKISYMLEDPGRRFRTVPNEGWAKTAGKSVLGGALAPFAGPQGKKAFRDWKDEEGSHYPVTTTAGSFAGGIVPEVAMAATVGKLPGVRNLSPGMQAPVQATAAGGLVGAANEEQGALQGALGGLSGSITGQILANRFLPNQSKQPQFTQDLITKQRNKGYNALPGFQSGRRSAEQVDMALKKNTSTADDIQERLRYNRQLLNKETAKAIGLESDVTTLDRHVLASRRDNINEALNEFYAKVNPKFVSAAAITPGRLRTKYLHRKGEPLPKSAERFITRFDTLRKLAKSSNNKSVGKQLRQFMTDINDRAREESTAVGGNRALGEVYMDMANTIDKAVERGVGKKVAQEWRNLRQQQGLLINLIEKDPQIALTGNVTPSALVNIFRKGKGRTLDYIKKNEDLWDSASFVYQQEQAFDNSLKAGQKLGHYLNPNESAGVRAPAVGLLAGASSVPLHLLAPVNAYLNADYIRTAAHDAAMRRAGVFGGAVGANTLDLSGSLGGTGPQQMPPQEPASLSPGLLQDAGRMPSWLEEL